MQIKDMFRKKIDREIQGVIIVCQGEETNMAQELEECVVTRELQRHFADFFAAYKKGIQGTTPKMGVWISGFFGSGKSHFLKILSYLLQNKQVGDKHAIDYFIEDQKITNQMVLADMQLAANTPSDVILFNIDSKSDSNGKENKDAIVNVFLKVDALPVQDAKLFAAEVHAVQHVPLGRVSAFGGDGVVLFIASLFLLTGSHDGNHHEHCQKSCRKTEKFLFSLCSLCCTFHCFLLKNICAVRIFLFLPDIAGVIFTFRRTIRIINY